MESKKMSDEQLLWTAYEQSSGARTVLHDLWEHKGTMNPVDQVQQVVGALRQALAAAQELEVRARDGRLHV